MQPRFWFLRRIVVSWRHVAVTWLVAVACTATPPQTYPAPAPAEIAASYDRVWSAVIDHFAERSVPIRTIEKASGIIATEPMSVSPDYGRTIADCGVSGFGEPWDVSLASYNVRVTGDSARSTIRITAIFVHELKQYGFTCNSRGRFERDLMTSVKTRAESR